MLLGDDTLRSASPAHGSSPDRSSRSQSPRRIHAPALHLDAATTSGNAQALALASSPTHEARELFPSDEVLALSGSPPSPTSEPSSEPSASPGESPPNEAHRQRHHLRSSSLLEAAKIPPREATWQCLGDEKGLQFADGAARSWEDEPVDYGVPCPANNVREVHDEAVLVVSPLGEPVPDAGTNGKTRVRRRTLQRDPDSPD